MFEFVKKLVKINRAPDLKKLYSKRAELLVLSGGEIRGNILDYRKNISNIIDFLLEDEPSLTTYNVCSNCEARSKLQNQAVFSPNLTAIYEEGLIDGLQKSLDTYNERRQTKCMSCQSLGKPEYDLGPHLIIDIEALKWVFKNTKKQKNSQSRRKFGLNEIPIDLKFIGCHFKLMSVVEFIDSKPIGHYKSLVRYITGCWEIHDGISKASEIHYLFFFISMFFSA